MATINYGEVGAITQKYFVPKLVDNIFTSNVLLQRARQKWMEKIDGGTQIIQPVAYATTTASGWYQGSDTLNTTANDQIDNAIFDWAFLYANITVARTDELKNSGREQIVNFVKSKVQLAEKTMANNLGTALYTGTSAAVQIVGLQTAVGTGRTYGSIADSTYTWWTSQIDSTTTALSIPALRTLLGKCTIGSDKPSVIVTTQAMYDALYGLLQPQQRFMDSETANAGFVNLMFEGKPYVVDNRCPTGYLYAINEDYIHLFVHKDEDFRFEPFIKPTNQNVSSAKIYWAGALVVDNPRMMGSFTGLVA
jgi:hypothetical protein